jgi:hypothetical protein
MRKVMFVIGLVGSAVLAGLWLAKDIRPPEPDRRMPTVVDPEVRIVVVAPPAQAVMSVPPQGTYAEPPAAYVRTTPSSPREEPAHPHRGEPLFY